MENFPLNFVADFLTLHNEYRANHGSSPLEIDDKLNERAQEWADTIAKKGVLEYRSDPDYGENIYRSFWRDFPYEIKPKDPLEMWYAEGNYFKYGVCDVKDLETVRRFTQLIWKNTESIGLGLANDDSGKFYFVCIYYPPGNVAGEFVENVLPPIQKEDQDQELPPDEAKDIRKTKSDLDVVRSMERIYAVPSEKLRVWSIWLTNIGEIADEWQKWLRAHIDFVIRLAEELQKADEVLKQEEDGYQPRIEPSEVAADQEEEEVPRKVEDFDQGTIEARSEISSARTLTDMTLSAESRETTEAKSREILEEESEETSATKSGETLTAKRSNEEEFAKIWPIGTPWKHSGIEEEDDSEPFERLPLPRTEEEMREFLKNFTHEATIYRSYYKHWKDTADLAIKEVGGRLVITTFLVQGLDKFGKVKGPPRPKLLVSPKSARISRKGRKPRRSGKRGTKSSGISLNEKSEGDSIYTAPHESAPQTGTVDEEQEEQEKQDEQEKQEEQEEQEEQEKQEEQEEQEEQEATPTREPLKESSEVSVSAETMEKTASKTGRTTLDESKIASVRSQFAMMEADDFVRDNARSSESVPYIFYLTAEPDIDVAIEHDDEKVIPADTDREHIVGAYKRLFFNLVDKPCKGGKPWI